MNDILVVVPSLRRADNAARFVEAWQAMTSGKSDLLFVLEDNDETQGLYPLPDTSAYMVGNLTYLIGEYRSLGNAFNAAFQAHPDYVAYAPWNDDHLVRTPGWEGLALTSLAENGGIVYGDDGFQGERLATAPIIDGNLVRALGYISPPGIPHMYIDDSWMAIGRALGRLTYLPDLLVEHMHPEANKAAWDTTYRDSNSAAAYQRDRAAFSEWLEQRSGDDLLRAEAVYR